MDDLFCLIIPILQTRVEIVQVGTFVNAHFLGHILTAQIMTNEIARAVVHKTTWQICTIQKMFSLSIISFFFWLKNLKYSLCRLSFSNCRHTSWSNHRCKANCIDSLLPANICHRHSRKSIAN